ncbi:MAG: hypothetical protein A3E88_06870 [Legionellales bacterium RIFCSPHIGHO2_12_FULL_35_11]|nr:MAG: hypothetical protein A3E88_06870 [Legionellales bacterium RIFCSPHIGHO2_12_FULL_35_11]
MLLILRKFLLAILILVNSSFSFAVTQKPLDVAVLYFFPPFVMPSGNGGFSGFDISLVQNVCDSLQRVCNFRPMRFRDLISSVETGQTDMAVSGLMITMSRLEHVHMSVPYMPSASRFVGRTEDKVKDFSIESIKGKNIGVLEGTTFFEELKGVGVGSLRIFQFKEENEQISALDRKIIDYILVDNVTAKYWQSHSNNKLVALGEPMTFGLGYGIAVNPRNPDLLNDVNQALKNYIGTVTFQQNMDIYFSNFE